MIVENRRKIEEIINATAVSVGRNGSDVKLIAVSKTKSVETIRAAYDAGLRIFGENKVQELIPKIEQLPADIQWHMIGALQTNKVKYIIGKVALIHSVDRFGLAKEIQKQSLKHNVVSDILVQVNISKEDTKSGVEISEIRHLIDQIIPLKNICIRGLMSIASNTDDLSIIRDEFHEVSLLRKQLVKDYSNCDFSVLSMGMSHDYQIAIEEGATHIRLGTAIFGKRYYP